MNNYKLEMGMTKHKAENWMQHKKRQQAEKRSISVCGVGKSEKDYLPH